MGQCERKVLFTLISVLLLAGIAGAEQNPCAPVDVEEGENQRIVDWLYDSPLCVNEVITDIGGGMYEYSYSFENVDNAHIWHFGIWTTFSISANTVWDGHPEWGIIDYLIDDVADAYDARNLDPAITHMVGTWGPDWPNSSDPIVPGETVTGFSYIASVNDNSPKYYYYETVENGWAQDTGYLAAVGLITGVTAVEAGSWGQVKALY